MKKTDKYLQHSVSGAIFGWNKHLAANADMKTVTAEEAFPEKFMTPKQKKRVSRLKLEAELDEPVKGNDDINIDASRNLPQ